MGLQYLVNWFVGICRHIYASAFAVGGILLRPWMLGYRRDFSFTSSAEPEQLIELTELMLSEGCQPESVRQ